MYYNNILIVVGLIVVLMVIVNLTVSRRVIVNKSTEKPILDNKENMEENKPKLDFGVWTGLKFGFGFGLGVLILGFLISIVLTLMGFTLTKILMGGLSLFN